MRRSTCLLAAVLTFALLLAQAPLAQADNSQQDKMTTCNANATSQHLSGTDRQAYMKTCLSSAPPAAAKTNSQQEKMKTCNADATTKGLSGTDRQAYMKTCLSSSSTAH
jgi:hypothetical protein